MKVRLALLVGLLVFLWSAPGFAQAPCTAGANVFLNVDPSTAGISAALAMASDGYLICLKSGTATWSSNIDMTLNGTITGEIRGAGPFTSTCLENDGSAAKYLIGGCGSAGQTIVHLNGGAIGAYRIPGNSGHNTISNIRFTQDNTSSVCIAGTGCQIVGSDDHFGDSGAVLVVHHNDFIITNGCDSGNQTAPLRWSGNGGVIYRNRLIGINLSGSCIGFVHIVNTDQATQFQSASTFGSADSTGLANTYFEQNYIEGYSPFTDLGFSSRDVMRFNEAHNSAPADHGYDSGKGGRGYEINFNQFYCDQTSPTISNWLPFRGSTGYIIGNILPAGNVSKCGTPNPTQFQQTRTQECSIIAGWPGQYNDGVSHTTYPISHQMGWGWLNSSNVVGTNAKQALPGTGNSGFPPQDGFQQNLESWYAANNTNNTGANPFIIVKANTPSDCRAMAYSTVYAGGTHTTLTLPQGAELIPYANSGQEVIVIFADAVGGTTPTFAITGSDSATVCTPSALATPVTNGGVRLSAVHCTATTDESFTVTATTDSSSANRALEVIVLRGMAASTPLDTHPAMASINSVTTPITAPSSTSLATCPSTGMTACDIVISYYAFAGNVASRLSPGPSEDSAPHYFLGNGCTTYCGPGSSVGINSTTTGSGDVTIASTYRVVNAATAIAPTLTNTGGAVSGVAGVFSFKASGSTDNLNTAGTPFDLQSTDFIQADREFYQDRIASGLSNSSTTGAGTGLASAIPNGPGGVCTNGVGYWATDIGTWNTTSYNSGQSGVLFKCGVNATSGHWPATLNVANAFYVPATMPHTLDNVVGGNSMSFTQQPTSLQSGTTFSIVVKVTVNPPAADSITITKNCAGGTLTGTTTVTSNGTTGDASFTGLGMTGVDPSCTLTATNNTDATISPITSNAFALTCAPTKVVFTSQPTGASLGASLGTVKVTEEDNSGNICSLASDTITLSKDAGATWGTLVSASNLAKAASAGVATWTDLSVTTTAGSGSIDATSPGLTSAVSNSITISGGGCTPDHLTFIAQPQNALLGQNIGTIQVAVKDSGGNTCNDTSTVTLAAHTGTCVGMTLNGTLSGAAVAGVFQTSNVNATVATGSCSLDATDGVLTLATSNPFTIRAPAAGAGGRAGMVIRRGRH